MITKTLNKTIAVFLTTIFIFGLVPAIGFAQPNLPSLGEVKGFNRAVFDSHFSRADREISPERWLAEARLGVSQAVYAWELTASRLYENLHSFKEEKIKVEKWSDEELEIRFSQWLSGRFFGDVKEKALMNFSASLGVIQKNYLWHLDKEGNIVFDDNTGDPLIVRPDDEGREFSSDLIKWRTEAGNVINASSVSINVDLFSLYPELLDYIPKEKYESLRAIFNETGASVSESIRREFENIAAREEKIFTSRRTRDIWSLRKKSNDEAARIFTEKLIAETENACAQGIEELTARIEQADAGIGDLALLGEEWLNLYREQFEKGLKAWEEAEERFFIRRIEWEQESFSLLSEGENLWLSAFDQFKTERNKWELKAKNLFESGETLFKNISEDFQNTIADAKREFELNMDMRIGAGTTKVKALIDMYLVCASAAVSTKENIVFWLNYYDIGSDKDPAAPDFEQWLLDERLQIWKILKARIENNVSSNNNNDQYLTFIQDIIDGNVTLEDEVAFAKENTFSIGSYPFTLNLFNHNRFEKLVEIQNSYNVYISYLDKALDVRERILADYAELIGTGVLKDIISSDASSEDFCLDEYQIALVRAKALVLYWERKTAIANAVMAYAQDLSAGRMTEAEGIRAWEEAKAAYDESLAAYKIELDKLNALGDDIQNQQEALESHSSIMMLVEEKLNKLNSDYSILINNSVINHAEYYLTTLKEKCKTLMVDYESLLKTGNKAIYKTVLESGLKWGLSKQNEDAADAFNFLLNGDNKTISLAELEEKVTQGLISENELKIRLAAIDLFYDIKSDSIRSFNSNYSGADWYAAAKSITLSSNEKSALYGNKLKEKLITDYKKASKILLEKRLELELEALKIFLEEDHYLGEFEYQISEYCLLDVDTAALIWDILFNLQERILQGKNTYIEEKDKEEEEEEDEDENNYIFYFINGGSFFEIQFEELLTYNDEYIFCISLLNYYMEYEAISSFSQKEAWNTALNSLTSLLTNYGINQTGTYLPDAAVIYDAISKKNGDLVYNTAQFLKDFDNCFTSMPQWLENEKENWKSAFMKYAAAKMYNSNIQSVKTFSDIYDEQEELLSMNKELYNNAYNQYYMEDDEMETLNNISAETNDKYLTLDYMGKIITLLDNFRFEESYSDNEKHWRNFFITDITENKTPVFPEFSTWKDGVLADALFGAVYFTNRINDSFTLFSLGGSVGTEQSSSLNKALYSNEASFVNRKFSSLEYQYDNIAYYGRAYDLSQLEGDEVKIKKELISTKLAEEEVEFNKLRNNFFDMTKEFLDSGLLYDEQYIILNATHDYTDQCRFEYEKQDAIKRWASTAYLDKETIDPQYCKTKLEKAQTVMTVLSDINNNQNNQSSNDSKYLALYSEYEKSFSRKIKILEVIDSLSLSMLEDKNKHEAILTSYKAVLNNLGHVEEKYDDYTLPAEMEKWTVKDFIYVKNGKLAFLKDDSMNLSGVDASTAAGLNKFFKDNYSGLSGFEESLQALSIRMSEYFTDIDKIKKWGLACDYFLSSLLNNNGDIKFLADNYSGMGHMTSKGSLGKLQVKPGIGVLDYERDLYKLLTEDEWVNWFSEIFFTPNTKFKDYQSLNRRAWEELSNEEKSDLEYYIILTLSGNGYSAGFLKTFTLDIYEITHNFVDKKISDAKKEKNKPYNFLLFYAYDIMIDINKNALKRIKSVYEETKKEVEKWKSGIMENLSSIKDYDSIYKASCDMLAVYAGEKENGQSITWDDILNALRNAESLNTEDIEEIRISWKTMQGSSAGNFKDIDSALNGLLYWAVKTENNSRIGLETYWQNNAQERLTNEKKYNEAVEAYLAGTGSVNELKAAAEKAYANNTVIWKNHLTNMHTSLMNDLSLYTGKDKNFFSEFSMLGDEIITLTERALTNRYSMEYTAREIEWNFLLLDINDKYNEWRNSAAIILENGRVDWNAGYQKMQEAYRQWAVNFENEYNRVNEEWTIAYLAGIDDKERWLEQAAYAANHALDESTLSLLGAEGERLSRLVDTREPFSIRDAVPQTQSLMDDLLLSSGITNMAKAFSSMNNISNTSSTVVKRGMGGVSAWDAILVKSAASDLAKKTNAEIAAGEAKKLAATAQIKANQIIDSLSEGVKTANQSFRESMDKTFITNGLWTRSGNNYVKDIIKGSTLFTPVITETVTVKGYVDYEMEPLSRPTYLDEKYLSTLDSYTIQGLIDNVLKEVNAYSIDILGKKDKEPKNIGRQGDPDNPRTQSPGKIGEYIGYDPDVKKDITEIKREAIFHDLGKGELGRMLVDYTYWGIIDSRGMAEQSMAGWDKRMWDDTGIDFKAPTIRTIGQIGYSVVSCVVSVAVTGATAGIGAAAIPLVIAGISTIDDFIFGSLDAAFGYKTWDEAGFEIGKSALTNTITGYIGAGFGGIQAVGGTFQGFTNMAMGVTNNPLTKTLIQTAMTGAQTAVTSLATSAISGITYNSNDGWGYNKDIFNAGANDMLGSVVSSMTSTLTTGTLQNINSGINAEKLKGFNHINKYDLGKFNSLAGSLAGEAVSYAFGNDFTLNLLNTSLFTNGTVNSGLLELHLGRDGATMNFGTGGANFSIDNLYSALKGAMVWNVNSHIGRYVNKNDFDSAIALRAQYGYGDEKQKSNLWEILDGSAELRVSEDGDVFTAETTKEDEKRIINIKGYQSGMSEEDQMRLAVLLGHEAYRDGVVTDDNNFETRSATLAHTEMALRMLFGKEDLTLDENLIRDIIAYNMGIDNFYDYVDKTYDSSADYWKLTREGNLEYDGLARLVDADGNTLRGYTEMGLNRNDDVEGALLWFLGIERDETAKVEAVRKMMLSSGLIHDANGNWVTNADNYRTIDYNRTGGTINYSSVNNGKTISVGSIMNLLSKDDTSGTNIREYNKRISRAPLQNYVSYKNGDNQNIYTTEETQKLLDQHIATYKIAFKNNPTDTLITSDLLEQYNAATMLDPSNKQGMIDDFIEYARNSILASSGKDIYQDTNIENLRSSLSINTTTYCNIFARDFISKHYDPEMLKSIFMGKEERANDIFKTFLENPNLERLDLRDWGINGIQGLADEGTLIIMAYYNNDGSGHIGFVGNSELTLNSNIATPSYNGINGTNLPKDHMVIVHAGVYTGIVSIVYATNGWLSNRNALITDNLYFYRVKIK